MGRNLETLFYLTMEEWPSTDNGVQLFSLACRLASTFLVISTEPSATSHCLAI